MLFSNQRKHHISLPATDEDGRAANLAFLIRYLCGHIMKDQRKDLFVLDGAVYAIT
jgi:ubiquitin related modifier 1